MGTEQSTQTTYSEALYRVLGRTCSTMYIPTISSLSLLTLPILNGLAQASFIDAHAKITAAPQYNPLQARQDFYYACETGYTSCIGWEDACCPQGAACAVISGQRVCDAECTGVKFCGHLCCDFGYQCSANNVCVKDVYTIGVPSDSVTLSVPAVTTSSSSSSSSGGGGQSESNGIFTILPWSTTTDETSVTPTASSTSIPTSSRTAPSSHAGSSSSVSGGTTPPVTSAGVSSSSGATTPASSTKPVQTGGASAASALYTSSVPVWMLVLFLGIAFKTGSFSLDGSIYDSEVLIYWQF